MLFVPAPDGERIALISLTGLSFLDLAAGERGPDVLTYPRVGLEVAFPSGVWSQDSSAFVITGPIGSERSSGSDFTIWKAPADGSSPQLLASYSDSHSDPVTFSPDGRHAAYFQGSAQGATLTDYGWFVLALGEDVGALASGSSAQAFWQGPPWSPSGAAYALCDGTLFQLCPDAAQETEVCLEVLELGQKVASIRWIDGDRFLWVTREPYDLYFGRTDGTRIRLAEGAERFAALAQICRNDAELASGGEAAAQTQLPPNTGSCTWDDSYRLAFLGGERMSGPRVRPLRSAVPPRGELELSFPLISPRVCGRLPSAVAAVRARWFAVRRSRRDRNRGSLRPPSRLAPDQGVARNPVGSHPRWIAVDDGAAWVSNEGSGTVCRVDLRTNRVAATVPVGSLPRRALAAYGAVCVANIGDGTISRIDPATDQVGVAAAAGEVWVVMRGENAICRLRP